MQKYKKHKQVHTYLFEEQHMNREETCETCGRDSIWKNIEKWQDQRILKEAGFGLTYAGSYILQCCPPYRLEIIAKYSKNCKKLQNTQFFIAFYSFLYLSYFVQLFYSFLYFCIAFLYMFIAFLQCCPAENHSKIQQKLPKTTKHKEKQDSFSLVLG